MLRSTITFIFRNFIRNLSYSVIAMSSLVVGLTTAILLFVWVQHEVSYNKSIPDNERVFALLINEEVEGEIETEEGTSIPIMDFLTREVPEVESVSRVDNSRIVLTHGEKSVQKMGVYADSSFFNVHQTQVAGNAAKPFPTNRSIAISQTLADLLFEKGEALGKIITVDHKTEFTVTAVYQSYPDNSHFGYIEFVLPFDAKSRAGDEWVNYDIKLSDPSAVANVEQKIDKKFSELSGNANSKSLLFALSDWRLHWNFENGQSSGGRITYVIIFCVTGIFVLIMACVNYMNMATARATKRMREIGVRKVAGATKLVLVKQFMTESLIFTSLATGISLMGAYVLLPLFNQLVSVNFSISFSDPALWIGLSGVLFFTTLLAGAYPAFLLSSFKPALVLKGIVHSNMSGSGLRKSLVVFQFTLSVIIIFCALVMWQQTDFLLKKDLGYDKHRVINVWLDDDRNFSLENLRASILAHSSVESVAFSGASPMEINGYAECNRAASPLAEPLLFYGANIDEHTLATLKFELVQGRNFSSELASDSNNFIISQKAADLLGFKNPIGERITYNMYGDQEGEIVGVIADFQNDDIHIGSNPVVFSLGKPQYIYNMFVRYEEGKVEEATTHLKSIFEKIQPGIPVAYSFLDSDFEGQLYMEKQLGNISVWFTIIVISLACLGLFGLVLFNTQRRVKEIGIRKVLGASVNQMMFMLCRDFMKPVLYSFALAFPAAFYLMEKYLENYASRIAISVGSFALVGSGMIILVLITISYQSLKAANQNPVESLKTE